jgi:hypothetical protein
MAHAHCMQDNLGYNTHSEYVRISLLYFDSNYNNAPKLYVMIHFLVCLVYGLKMLRMPTAVYLILQINNPSAEWQ